MNKNKKLQTGDIFSIQTENAGGYIYGRVLFDTEKQFTEDGMRFNYLDWHGKSLLIETYKYVSLEEEVINPDQLEKAINSIFIDKKILQKRISGIVTHTEVDYKQVSFPEALKRVHREGILFVTGELAIKTDLSSEEADKVRVFPTYGNIYFIEIATLDYSGRTDLIEEKEDISPNYFAHCDIRSLPKVHKEIYDCIGENLSVSYYELSLKHGYDLGRLY